MVVADYDLARAEHGRSPRSPTSGSWPPRSTPPTPTSVAALVREHRGTHVMNAVDPRFVMPIFNGAYAAGADYLDMAMSLSQRHPDEPYAKTGVMLGDEQFAVAADWEQAGRLALVGMGVEPGLSDVFARYAADELFSEIDELGTRDGANLTVDGYDFAPSFSIWTTIEECLNPPVIWEKERGWFVTEPFSEPEVFDFPGGIGPVECVNVEHEEVLLMPRWVDAKRVTFKYGLGNEFIDVLKALHKLGLDRTDPVTVKGVVVSARAMSSPPACPTRRTWATRCAARPAPGSGSPAPARTASPARCTCTTWSTTRRPCASTARSAWSGRRRSTRSSPWNCWRPAPGPARECSVRRPSRPARSSTCWPTATDPRGGWEDERTRMSNERRVELTRRSRLKMTATNNRGGTLDFGDEEAGEFTPVELLLVAIAGCTGMDVDAITRQAGRAGAVRRHGHRRQDPRRERQPSDQHRGDFSVVFPEGEAGDAARDVLPIAIQKSHDRLCTVSRTVELGTPVNTH